MRVMPASMLQRMIDNLMRGMRREHPRLFQNLERLNAARLRIEPADLPHRFILAFGGGETSLTVANSDDSLCTAGLTGKLDALLNLLEGRIDGDMLFFSRDIEITGNTSVVVALRNTIDREEINLLDDITAPLGPFARPVRKIAALMNRASERINERLAEIVEKRTHSSAAKSENDTLRTEIQALKTRLAKIEAHSQRKKAAAQ
jgi:predicted lipid carrier protein YhbT